MIAIIKKLQEVYANLWGPHKPASITGKNYVVVPLDKLTHKSWVLILRSKNEFFNAFKLWLLKAKASGRRLDCLQTDGRGEFINATFQSFC